MASQRQARTGSGRQSGAAKPGSAKSGSAKSGTGKPGTANSRASTAKPTTAKPSTAVGPAQVDQGGAPSWVWLSTFIVSLAGLGASIYLTIEHFTSNTLAGCAENATINCTKVTTSAQSVVFGIFPVAVLGLAFFVFMVAINSPWGWRWKLPIVRWARLASVVVGIGFVLYLVYAELFQIQAICLYCTAVHVLTFLLFAIIVFDSTFRPAPPRTTAQRP